MAVRRLLGVVAALVVGVGVSAAPAGTVYGLLGHYEVCSNDGDYASLASVTVRDNVFVGDRSDDVVRVLSQGGRQLATIPGTGRPGERFDTPIVSTSPIGALYVISKPIDPRLFKFVGTAFERGLAQGEGPYGNEERLRAPAGLVAGGPGSRGSATGEVYVPDVTLTGLPGRQGAGPRRAVHAVEATSFRRLVPGRHGVRRGRGGRARQHLVGARRHFPQLR